MGGATQVEPPRRELLRARSRPVQPPLRLGAGEGHQPSPRPRHTAKPLTGCGTSTGSPTSPFPSSELAFRDERDIQERSHDIAAQLLTGKLFTGFDEKVSGPFDLRFKASVGNAIRNMVEREIEQAKAPPDRFPSSRSSSRGGLQGLRTTTRGSSRTSGDLVRRRLGGSASPSWMPGFGGEEMKGLAVSPLLGSLGKNRVKQVVCRIKELAREYAIMRGRPRDAAAGREGDAGRGGDRGQAAGDDGGEKGGGGVSEHPMKLKFRAGFRSGHHRLLWKKRSMATAGLSA